MRSLQWMLRHNAGYYVKHVQNGMDAMLPQSRQIQGMFHQHAQTWNQDWVARFNSSMCFHVSLFEKLVGSCHAGLTKKTSN